MKIAVTDYTFSDLNTERSILCAPGEELVAIKEIQSPANLCSFLEGADAVITQFAPVNAEVIGSLDRARVIVRYGIGVDNVDLQSAREHGIPVCNVPDYCIDEVADHTLAFILAATRQVVANDQHLKHGNWGLGVPLQQMKALRDMTVGVVGFGRIGREVVARLRPFKPRLLVADPVAQPNDIKNLGAEPVSLETLFAESDLITLHCPSTAQTRGLINRNSLQQLRPGVILVNLGRGDLIEPDALLEGLKSGYISAASLDVFQPEPLPKDHPLLSMKNVTVASHIASTSVPAVRKLRETVAKLAAAAVRGEPLWNVVNGVDRPRSL